MKIYGAYEYNCTTDEYRVLTDNTILPFMKKNKWYTKEEFHIAHVEHALEPFKDLLLGEDSLAENTPTKDLSNSMLNEINMLVNCDDPKDVLL